MDSDAVVSVPVRRRSSDYEVVIDPTLDRRGRTEPAIDGVRLGRILLRRWDEEVFLHECIHALLWRGGFVSNIESPYVSGDEEEIVRHLSHGLFEQGWRYQLNEVTADG